MPLVKSDPFYKAKRLEKLIKQKLIEYDMTYQILSEKLNISYPTFHKRKQTGTWTFDDLSTIFKVLCFTDEDKLKVFSS